MKPHKRKAPDALLKDNFTRNGDMITKMALIVHNLIFA